MSITHSQESTNKKLFFNIDMATRDLLNLRRDRVICWRSSELFNERNEIARLGGYEDARIPSTE